MLIIGCDFHPSFQQISCTDLETGEYVRRRLEHKGGEAERFYRNLKGQAARVGIEATGGTRWFERLLGELGIELWVGDPARVRAAAAHKAHTDKKDADLLMQLLLENRFPRLWVPTVEQRDERQLVLHRHRLVQTRTRAKNQLQALATNEGLHRRVSTRVGQAELKKVALSSWGQVRAGRLVGDPGGFEPADQTLGPGVAEASRAASGNQTLDDASWSGTGGGHGLCGDAVRSASLQQQQESDGVFRNRAAGRLQWQRATMVRPYHQAGEQPAAGIAGGSGTCGRAL